MDRRWSRWKIWLLFLLVIVVTAIVMIPRADGAGTDLYTAGDYTGALPAFEKEPGETTGPALARDGNNIAVTGEPTESPQEKITNRSTK